MFKALATAAVATAALASAAAADQITLTEPMTGAAVHDGGVDLSAYWTETEAGMELVATYVPRQGDREAHRMTMLLNEGDRLSFGLPDAPQVHYDIAVADGAVEITASRVGIQLAKSE